MIKVNVNLGDQKCTVQRWQIRNILLILSQGQRLLLQTVPARQASSLWIPVQVPWRLGVRLHLQVHNSVTLGSSITFVIL
jgi:hypothetical protein